MLLKLLVSLGTEVAALLYAVLLSLGVDAHPEPLANGEPLFTGVFAEIMRVTQKLGGDGDVRSVNVSGCFAVAALRELNSRDAPFGEERWGARGE